MGSGNREEAFEKSTASLGKTFQNFLDAFFEVVREDVTCGGSTPFSKKQQFERSLFLEDPTDSTGGVLQSLNAAQESSGPVRKALALVEETKQNYNIDNGLSRIHHLKPVSHITGKLAHLVDLKVIVVERLPAEDFASSFTSSSMAADWTFVVLADATGSVIGAFPPDAPSHLKRLLKQIKRETSAIAATVADLFAVNNILLLQAVKSMSCMGMTMITFSKQTRAFCLGNFTLGYLVNFSTRGG